MYYKAELILSTESMEYDKKEKAYIGYDPDTYQDHGVIRTLTGSSIEELKKQLAKEYDLKDAQVYDGALELQYDGEHDYRTPVEERVPFMEMIRVVFSQVEETTLDVANIYPELKES